jgi:putrescine aminotransferase
VAGSEEAVSADGSSREQVLDAYRAHLSAGMAGLAEFMHAPVEARAQGSHVWDHRGQRYLSCGGYGVFILGHCHPRVVEAVVDQVRSNPVSTRVLLNPAMAEAASALARVAPEGLEYVYFAQSGAEAVETALKLARLNGRRRVVAMENGFHGKTLGALSATGRNYYRTPFEPLLADVEFVPFGRAEALATALASGPEACVVLEPVQAEGGVAIPPVGYLADVERACREHGAFLVLDEVQTGLGRLGEWWGADREAVTPDVLVVGKALGGGVVPVSAVVASETVFAELSRNPLLHTSTFSGAPAGMAAATATIAAIEEEDIVPRATRLGERLLQAISSIVREACPSHVREVRGAGLLIGIEFQADYLAFDFLIEMLDRHVILAHSMNAPEVIRVTPPAVLDDEDVEWLEAAIRASAEALATR